MKKLLLLFVVSFFSIAVFSQYRNIEEAKLYFSNKTSVGVIIGYDFYHIKNDLINLLEDQGYSFISPEYHVWYEEMNWQIDLSYSLNPNRDFGILINLLDRGDVPVYNDSTMFSYLSLDYVNRGFIPYYRRTNLTRKLQADVGLSANWTKVVSYSTHKNKSKFNLGVMVGGSYGIIENQFFYLRLNGQFHINLLPYQLNSITQSVYNTTQMKYEDIVVLERQDIWFKKIALSFALGWKF